LKIEVRNAKFHVRDELMAACCGCDLDQLGEWSRPSGWKMGVGGFCCVNAYLENEM